MFTLPDISGITAAALAEDFGVPASVFADGARPDPVILERDVTTFSLLPDAPQVSARIVAREKLVVCGLPVAADVFERLSIAAGLPEPVELFPLVAEGRSVEAGSPVAEIEGPAAIVLGAERTALNLLMVLSGIATEARRWCDAAGDRLRVVDTRKTYPGLRELSKYATRVGGATNHRHGLWDMVLVKDNHLHHVGLGDAIARARHHAPGVPVQVEVETIVEALDAIEAGADLLLLDNMDDAELERAVEAVREAADANGTAVVTEASGDITFGRLASLRRIGVDRVSTSAITLAPPRDLALDIDGTA